MASAATVTATICNMIHPGWIIGDGRREIGSQKKESDVGDICRNGEIASHAHAHAHAPELSVS